LVGVRMQKRKEVQQTLVICVCKFHRSRDQMTLGVISKLSGMHVMYRNTGLNWLLVWFLA
jgi:hypothetical protein